MATDIEVRRPDRSIARLWDWFEPGDVTRFFDRLRPLEDHIRVEEEVVGGDLVIRAELPGVDPDKDVEVSVDRDVLTVRAERRMEDKSDKDGQFRSEFRYGSFQRSLRMPAGVSAKDVQASYRDGILEVKVPMPTTEEAATKVAISKN